MLNLSLYATLGEPTKASVGQWVGFRATVELSRLCLNCATMVSVGRRYTRLRKRSTLDRRAPHGPVVPSLRRSHDVADRSQCHRARVRVQHFQDRVVDGRSVTQACGARRPRPRSISSPIWIRGSPTARRGTPACPASHRRMRPFRASWTTPP